MNRMETGDEMQDKKLATMEPRRREVQEWIEKAVGEPFDQPFFDQLRDGILLCNMVNALTGTETVKKISDKVRHVAVWCGVV